jgi:hypothetical protein
MNIPIALALSAMLLSSGVAADRLNSKIGPAAPEKYQALRDAKDWRNPFLTLCADGVHLAAPATQAVVVATPELRAALIRLPVSAWPYGRVVAVQDCSVAMPEEDPYDRVRRLVDVGAELIALGVEIDRWPHPSNSR